MSFDTIEANWRTYLMFPLYQTFGPRHKSENNGGEPGERYQTDDTRRLSMTVIRNAFYYLRRLFFYRLFIGIVFVLTKSDL